MAKHTRPTSTPNTRPNTRDQQARPPKKYARSKNMPDPQSEHTCPSPHRTHTQTLNTHSKTYLWTERLRLDCWLHLRWLWRFLKSDLYLRQFLTEEYSPRHSSDLCLPTSVTEKIRRQKLDLVCGLISNIIHHKVLFVQKLTRHGMFSIELSLI